MTNEAEGLDLTAKIAELEAVAPELREQGYGALLDRLKRLAEIWGMPRGPERDAAMQEANAERFTLHNRRPARRRP